MSKIGQYRKAVVNVLTLLLAILSTVTVSGNAGHWIAGAIAVIGAILHFMVKNDPVTP